MDEQQTKEKPLNELLTSRIADIYVGPENTHWPLHEKLLCHYSPVLASKFYDKDASSQSEQSSSFGLPEEEEETFQMLVGWLYSRTLKPPAEENDIGPLLDLYLLAEKLEIEKLSNEVVELARQYYHDHGAYPGLRRVQYVYANTKDDNAMREMLVSAVARYLALGDAIPAHWNKALKKNGELAVDIIRAIQEWHLESRSIPDVRETGLEHGRGIFSKIEEGSESFTTQSQASNTTPVKGDLGEQEADE